MECLNDLLCWLEEKGNEIGILDGSNVNQEERLEIANVISLRPNVHKPLWIQIDCNNEALLKENFTITKLPELQVDGGGETANVDEIIKNYQKRIEYLQSEYNNNNILLLLFIVIY